MNRSPLISSGKPDEISFFAGPRSKGSAFSTRRSLALRALK
jgi:hypothetical protein